MLMKKQIPGFVGFCAIAVLLMVYSDACRAGIRDGIKQCQTVLIPALFPFCVLFSLWLGSGKTEPVSKILGQFLSRFCNLPPSSAIPLAAGMIGGYPLGARVLAEMVKKREIEPEHAASLSMFCNNPGPAFMIGAVGASILNSALLGAVLWIVCILTSLLTGILTAQSAPRVQEKRLIPRQEKILTIFPEAVWQGVKTMLQISGTVVLFSGLQAVLWKSTEAFTIPVIIKTIAAGVLELTNGVSNARECAGPIRFILCGSMASWGGLCVHMQAAEALIQAGLQVRQYLLGKLIQTVLTLLGLCFLCPAIYPNVTVLRNISCIGMIAFLLVVGLLSFSKKRIGKKREL